MGRPLGNAGGAPLGELRAQHGDHLLAEQVELFEHGLQRQTGVVHEEQLPLVVAERLAEGEGLLDDLLRAAHGQRRLLGEPFERGAVAVDRRVVEVRAELPNGVLRVLPHEDLPAQADVRLLGAAVAVVRVPLAVEADQPLEVLLGPEDVVREEAVAVVGGLFGDLGAADGTVPDERRNAVQRARRGGEALERGAEAALPVHDVLTPQLVQQGVVLDGQRDALADVLAEPRVDRPGVAPAHHHVHPALRQVLEHGEILGDLHRVVGGDERGGRRQDQPLGARGDPAEHGGGRGGHERRVVVLAGGEDVQADLLGLQRDPDHGRDPLVLARRPARGRVGGDVADGEDSELHGAHLA